MEADLLKGEQVIPRVRSGRLFSGQFPNGLGFDFFAWQRRFAGAHAYGQGDRGHASGSVSGGAAGLAGKTADGAVVRRLLGNFANIGWRPRGEAAQQVGWSVRPCATGCIATTPRVWRGFVPAWALGVHPLLNEAQMTALKELVVHGPDPERDKVVRWRCIDLRDKIERRFVRSGQTNGGESGCANWN